MDREIDEQEEEANEDTKVVGTAEFLVRVGIHLSASRYTVYRIPGQPTNVDE